MKTFLTITLLFSLSTGFAHTDFAITKDFGNVKVRILTGGHYEEINKAFIIGQLAERYAEILCYSKPIFLDFEHDYTASIEAPKYWRSWYRINFDKGYKDYNFINFDKGYKHNNFKKKPLKTIYENDVIAIRLGACSFGIREALLLLKYAINHEDFVQDNQEIYPLLGHPYATEAMNINPEIINKILASELDPVQQNLLRYRAEKMHALAENSLNYYWQSEGYHFYKKSNQTPPAILLSLDEVFCFRPIGQDAAMVFDTDSSFYYISANVSKRHIFQNTQDWWEPFYPKYKKGEGITFSYYYESTKPDLTPLNGPNIGVNVCYKPKPDTLIITENH
ncbi:MAG: hypothetical protein AB8F95_20070 [Bacteroidia bacterium]